MRETLRGKPISNEFYEYHDKVNTILEDQEEIIAIHMAAIKEDAKLLTKESKIIAEI